MTLVIEAPSDAQLAYISDLCRKNSLPLPDCVASKTEASEIINRIRAGTYRYEDFCYPWDLPFYG